MEGFFMKYENEINEMLKLAIPKDSWTTDNEHEDIINESLKQTGITKQKLSDDIETGIKNGYTVEQQLDILKRVLNVA
jgi:hypothetical protein